MSGAKPAALELGRAVTIAVDDDTGALFMPSTRMARGPSDIARRKVRAMAAVGHPPTGYESYHRRRAMSSVRTVARGFAGFAKAFISCIP